MLRKYNITVNGKTYEVEVEEVGVTTSQNTKPQSSLKSQHSEPAKPQPIVSTPPTSADKSTVSAPMPGTIFEVRANIGDQVKKGDVLLILEAMKMENEIMAPIDGVVSHIHVSKGSSVSSGESLITLV